MKTYLNYKIINLFIFSCIAGNFAFASSSSIELEKRTSLKRSAELEETIGPDLKKRKLESTNSLKNTVDSRYKNIFVPRARPNNTFRKTVQEKFLEELKAQPVIKGTESKSKLEILALPPQNEKKSPQKNLLTTAEKESEIQNAYTLSIVPETVEKIESTAQVKAIIDEIDCNRRLISKKVRDLKKLLLIDSDTLIKEHNIKKDDVSFELALKFAGHNAKNLKLKKNDAKFFSNFYQISFVEHVYASLYHGVCFLEGRNGIEKNFKNALEYFKIAERLGSKSAENILNLYRPPAPAAKFVSVAKFVPVAKSIPPANPSSAKTKDPKVSVVLKITEDIRKRYGEDIDKIVDYISKNGNPKPVKIFTDLGLTRSRTYTILKEIGYTQGQPKRDIIEIEENKARIREYIKNNCMKSGNKIAQDLKISRNFVYDYLKELEYSNNNQ